MVVSEAVRPERLAEAWLQIEPIVDKTLAIVGDGTLDEVHTALFTPTATLHWIQDHTGPHGFFILTPQPGGVLFVWLAALFHGHDNTRLETFESLAKLARRHGYQELQFCSPRPGWLKAAKQYGYKPVEVTYSRRL